MNELPAGEAREDEREIEQEADRLHESEPRPAMVHEKTSVALEASDGDGKKSVVLGPDGQPAQIKGEVIVSLTAEEARHEELRKLKPCLSCGHSYFPRPNSDAGRQIRAHVSMMHQWKAVPPGETADQYMHCRRFDTCVHASQHCHPSWGEAHVYRKGWLSFVKAYIARRVAARRAS